MTPASAGVAGGATVSSSSLGTATPADLIPLLTGLYRDKRHRRGLLVVHARPEWDGTALRVDELTVPVHCCRTVLEIRDVLRHRMVLSYEALAEDLTPDDLLEPLVAAVPQPPIVMRDRVEGRAPVDELAYQRPTT